MAPNPARNLVIALVAQNENQALAAGAQSLSHTFIARGYRHHIINLFSPSGAAELLSYLKGGEVAFVVAFAGVGSRLELNSGINVWTATRTPFLCLWYDHPAYNYVQHVVDSPYVIHGYHVRDHLEMRLKYLPPSSSHGIYLSVADPIDGAAQNFPVAKREHQLVYAKTGFDPAAISEEWKPFPKLTREMIWSLVEQAKADRNVDLADQAAALFAQHSLPLTDIRHFVGIIQEADAYVRAWRSDLLAKALLPFPVHIFGRGWEYLKDSKGRAEFHPPITPHEYLEFCRNCKVVVNSNPLWRDGVHNRVENALNLGSLVLSDNTVKAEQVYKGLANYIGFEWQDSLHDKIAEALSRANDDQVDYLVAAETLLERLAAANTPNYLEQIEAAVDRVRQQ